MSFDKIIIKTIQKLSKDLRKNHTDFGLRIKYFLAEFVKGAQFNFSGSWENISTLWQSL